MIYLAIYWSHNVHDASWQNNAHVNVSVANFTMLRLFIVLFKDWLIDADTCLKNNCLWLVTEISSLTWTLFITFCGRSGRLFFSLTNPCARNFMTLSGKVYVLLYITTRVASLLIVIWGNILMRWLSAKNMIFIHLQNSWK